MMVIGKSFLKLKFLALALFISSQSSATTGADEATDSTALEEDSESSQTEDAVDDSVDMGIGESEDGDPATEELITSSDEAVEESDEAVYEGGDSTATEDASTMEEESLSKRAEKKESSMEFSKKCSDKFVGRVQKALKDKGHSVAVDCKFGKETRTAVQKIQRENNLRADGIVGKNTEALLFKK